MKAGPGVLVAFLGGVVFLLPGGAAPGSSLQPWAQAFTSPGVPGGMSDASGAGSLIPDTPQASQATDSSLYAEGTRAINQGRWADAVRIFSEVAGKHGEHADGALYWKAYAEDKLGQSKSSESTCGELRSSSPHSRWIEDCGALLVEIHDKSGKPVQIEPGQSDDVKLLALNALLRQDEPRALAEIQAILNGDASEKLKKEAQFILGNHYSNTTYAQIVHLSYVEGDVRIQRGESAGKTNSTAWEKAVADLPLETGFSLVTGAGRAEIEFENASTIYLGENSVLTFNDLHETAGVPYTELGLLTGTLSLYIRPYVAGERFVVHTSTNDLISRYPDKTYARIDSFTDALAVTPLAGGSLRLPGVARDSLIPGRTWTYLQGQLVDATGVPANHAFSAWDEWVADRLEKRDSAIDHVMEASGLPTPIPGMAELDGQGKFFDCAPYGTCWEPKNPGDQDEAQHRQPSPQPNRQPGLVLASFHTAAQYRPPDAEAPPASSSADDGFPCTPMSLRYRGMKGPATGQQTMTGGIGPAQSYDWAVCHAGSWIRHNGRYVWVAGAKRHHIDPVRWIRIGHQVAFVPLHPFDVKGQPAINARHEVFAVTGKNQIAVRPVKFDPGIPIEFLKDAPREYRTAALRPLLVADVPHMEAHPFSRAMGDKGIETARGALPIHFDSKSQTFQVARQQTLGGKTTTVFAPLSNRNGSLQARGESFAGGSGLHGNIGTPGGVFRSGSSTSSTGSHGTGGTNLSGASGSHASGGSSTGNSSSASPTSVSSTSTTSAHH